MKKNLIFLLAVAALTLSSLAHARSVYLNGIDISSVRNKKFLKAEVTIDEDGNVRIHAPQYDVKVVGAEAKAEKRLPNDRGGPNSSLLKRYYLVTQPSLGGRAQYEFSITVNGEERKVIRAGQSQVIVEISAWLHKGENEVVIKATKDLSDGWKSSSPSDKASVIVGIGHEENKIVKIDYIKGRMSADASQTKTITKHVVLVAE
jgi:hypothetical protein